MELNKEIQKNRIDKSIVLFFIAVIIMAASVFAYKFANYAPCQIVEFKTVAKHYNVGEIIRFKDYTKNVKLRTWDFGDSTTVDIESTPYHVYKTPGKYTVRLLVNDKCEAEQLITIKEKLFILDSTKLSRFKVPKFIKVGELLKVKEFTPNAEAWEWRFGETANVNSTLQNPTYKYKTPGVKTITLVTNGDPRYATTFKIRVISKGTNPADVLPPPRRQNISARQTNNGNSTVIPYRPPSSDITGVSVAPPPTPTTTVEKQEEEPKTEDKNISKSDFEKLLIRVADKTATVQDFDTYLCGNLSISTYVKTKKTTFKKFCDKISGKKITIKNLELYKNNNNGCIEYIKLDYKKGGLFK